MSNIYRKNIMFTCFVEQRNEQGIWKQITGFKIPYYDSEDSTFSTPEFSNANDPFDDEIYDDYTYAVLGHESLCYINNITPISKPKKLPYDLSDDIYMCDYDEKEQYGASYLTAKEIMDYEHKDDKISIVKYVTYEQYKKFKETGEVTEYRELPIGAYNQIVSNDYFDKFPQFTKMLTYTPIRFEKTISELCPWLFTGCLDQLMARSLNGTGDDVRIIYWMDDYYSDLEDLFLC